LPALREADQPPHTTSINVSPGFFPLSPLLIALLLFVSALAPGDYAIEAGGSLEILDEAIRPAAWRSAAYAHFVDLAANSVQPWSIYPS